MEHKERTKTSISPKGLNLSTPDNIVEDGALKQCYNLRYANGAWRNVSLFETTPIPQGVRDEIAAGAELAYIHPVGGKRIYITKKESSKTVEQIQYYAIRTTVLKESTESTTEGGWGDTLSGIIPPSLGGIIPTRTNLYYYLDAPLPDVGKKKVIIYGSKVDGSISDSKEFGLANYIENGTLYYTKTSNVQEQDDCIILRVASGTYRKGELVIPMKLYFPTVKNKTDISAEAGNRSAFVEKGGNYIFFGDVTNIDDNIYTIYDAENDELINFNVNSISEDVVFLPKNVGGVNCIDYVKGALYSLSRKESSDSVPYGYGYITNVTTEAPMLSDDGQFYYIDEKGEAVLFERAYDEEDERYEDYEVYESRFKTFLSSNSLVQASGLDIGLCCIAHRNKTEVVEKLCSISTLLSNITNNKQLSISNIEIDHSKDIRTTISLDSSSLTAYTDSCKLNTFGLFSTDIRIEHFGNALIVRDNESQQIYHYLFADNAYEIYGDTASNSLSFSVSVQEEKQSPNLMDVPMWYSSPGIGGGGGDKSWHSMAFVAAAEPIGGTATKKPTDMGLTTISEKFFRGEFAMFIVARAEDGTELYKSTPQIFRTENILNVDTNVLVYSPAYREYADAIEKVNVASGAFESVDHRYVSKFDQHFLVWGYEPLDKNFDLVVNLETPNIFSKYEKWKERKVNKEHANKIKTFLNNTRASKFYTLKVDISTTDDAVYDYAIYTTRLISLFELSKYGDLSTNRTNIFDELFYRTAVISGSEKEYILTAADFDNLEAKSDRKYVPVQTAGASFFAKQGFEYNNCMHSFGVSVNEPLMSTTQLYGANEGNLSHLMASREYDGITYYGVYPVSRLLSNEQSKLDNTQSYILSFNNALKDVRFGSYDEETDEFTSYGLFHPNYSSSLDSSFIINKEENIFDTSELGIPKGKAVWEDKKSTQEFDDELKNASRSFRKYKPILLNNLYDSESTIITNKYPINVPNRLQVSEANNPLSNPYDRSYRLGSLNNEIIAINSAAIEMSDAKFGEFPLYIFTKEGVYAMQTGTETLYSSIIPISQDVIINPSTLAVNGAVLFFTDKGLHMLSNQGSQLISAGLHKEDNRIPDWMRTCRLVYLPEFKEVMCVLTEDGITTGKAYVLSLENKCWSMRYAPEGFMLRNDEVVTADFGIAHDLTNEGSFISDTVTLETRPIKLGAGKELKRLETLIVRFESDEPQDIEVEILGSVDGVKWFDEPLRSAKTKTNTDVLIRRTPCSVKYLKFVVKCSNLSSDIRITGFDTEHYVRFTRRLR